VLAHRHAGGPIAATYDRWERFPEKREALEKWAEFLTGLMRPRLANVVDRQIGEGKGSAARQPEVID
jgi:hypothetical protein